MLCSVRTGKSGPNWLDRLRSSKGFPTDDGLTLDHFLQNSNNPTPLPLSPPKLVRPDPTRTESDPKSNKQVELYGIVTNVLSELFNFGNVIETPKKHSRKQTNPRICVLPEEKYSNNGNCVNIEEEEEEGNCGKDDLVGYSRTEVTVIDTSFACWKFDKVLFRRKNVWKVRDKKWKSKNVGRKRRKEKLLNEEEFDEEIKNNKKVKVSFSKDEKTKKQCVEKMVNENENQDDVSKETPDVLPQVCKKRSSFFRSARKSRQVTSSVFTVKDNYESKEIFLDAKNERARKTGKDI